MSQNRAAIIGTYFVLAFLLFFPAASLLAQRNRIANPVNNRQRALLTGHIHPQARAENDQGRVDPSLQLPYVTMLLKPSDSQQADLEQLLAEQQDPTSPSYHQWLTPEQYADRFGVSQSDLDQVAAWLQTQSLNVVASARGRNWIAFSGTAAQIEGAFSTELHRYLVNGTVHFANATEPSVPAAFAGVAGAIHGLNDFRMRPPRHSLQLLPRYDSTRGTHYLAPDDFAIIYDLMPLYSAGVNGSGQKMVVVGQSQINLADIEQFHSYFNLPGGDPTITLVPRTQDPGIVSLDESESDLDLELVSAVARNASITFVYSSDVMVSAQYAIDQNLAPVLSMSYGQCEAQTPSSDAATMQSWAMQANAQGMTWVAASGDSGAADCFDPTSRTAAGLSVDMPGSIPQVTSVGGTEFTEGSGNYWSSSNNNNHASALSYIPETSWNDSVADGTPSASGGGASSYFSKPSWQTGTGVPADGARDVPDVSFSASADHDGYMIYTGGSLQVYGGTSVGAPVFSGIVALLNQYMMANGFQSSAGLGNVNPRLYSLAQANLSAFHDITTGNNMVNPCPPRARTCSSSLIGYSAGVGYDLVTGLGSLDINNLVLAWPNGGVSARATPVVTVSSNATNITSSGSAILTVTVKGTNGATPTGSVTFTVGGTVLGTAGLSGSGGAATGALSVNGAQLAAGSNTIVAQYSGDGSFNGATGTAAIFVTSGQSGPPAIGGLTNGGSFKQAYAPGMILSVFGTQLAPSTASAAAVPLPTNLAGVSATVNGVTAPLYYVSPGQLNIQIPYETQANTTATLTVNNNGQTASSNFRVASAAPGIFTDSTGAPVPNGSAAHGQIVTLYVTGDGAVSPALATGSSPAPGTPVGNLPKPAQTVTLTIGGVQAPIQFIGIPSGLVGVTQINYQVPAQAATGTDSVVVTVGGVASPPANLRVTQ